MAQLMSLLDLQQKEDSLKEAIFSNDQALAAQEQAEETEAQSQILFLFTLVTIVFVSQPPHTLEAIRPIIPDCAEVAPIVFHLLLRHERGRAHGRGKE